MTHEKTHHITTEERTYSHVHGKEHFAKVRKTWGDTSEIVRSWVWETGEGWVAVDTTGW